MKKNEYIFAPTPKVMAEVIDMLENGELNSTNARKIIKELSVVQKTDKEGNLIVVSTKIKK